MGPAGPPRPFRVGLKTCLFVSQKLYLFLSFGRRGGGGGSSIVIGRDRGFFPLVSIEATFESKISKLVTEPAR